MTEETYKTRRVRASFRGFEFLTDSHDAKGGRRLPLHEYPYADEPFVEDLGAKPWDYKLNAYFIGENYDLERNGFLEKLNEPGADWLTHPWLGEKWVRAKDWSLHESNDKDGFCTIGIEFVPGGEQPFEITVDKVDVAYERVRRFADAAVDDFGLIDAANWLDEASSLIHQATAFLYKAIAYATLPLTFVNKIIRAVQGFKAALKELLSSPKKYANAFRSLLNLFKGFRFDAGFGKSGSTRREAASKTLITRFSKEATRLSGVLSVSYNQTQTPNQTKLNTLHAALYLEAAAHTALEADFVTEAAKNAAQTALLKGIDALLPQLSDPVYLAALEMRAALQIALEAQNITPTQSREILFDHPAVLLAHRLEVDVEDFCAINQVRHPLFVKGRVYG